MAETVIDKRAEWDAFLARVRAADGTYVKVGVTSDVGTTEKKIAQAAAKKEGSRKKAVIPTLAQVAWWNEFGTRNKDDSVHVPERSFVRSTHDEARPVIGAVKKGLLRKVFQGRLTIGGALKLLGEWMQSRIQRKITDTYTPPNAPRTLAAKFPSTHPLIDIGQLRQSIRYEVHEGTGSTIDTPSAPGVVE